ncbi:hypothetical protein EJ04DRAFT_14701 [Polyplosphaeria fusca]|uniref:Uncharacterized protein n=1 Tax=Polyplosphaeria fusca TaxID=682080 RepID=A0A9P4UZL3_9PLEO|nr:hypothetical protein EJ04DRAFT_14701 [Polyplosphaeria fusca]
MSIKPRNRPYTSPTYPHRSPMRTSGGNDRTTPFAMPSHIARCHLISPSTPRLPPPTTTPLKPGFRWARSQRHVHPTPGGTVVFRTARGFGNLTGGAAGTNGGVGPAFVFWKCWRDWCGVVVRVRIAGGRKIVRVPRCCRGCTYEYKDGNSVC